MVQAARLEAGGHQKHIRTRFDIVGERIVIGDFHAHARRILRGQVLKELFILGLSRTEGDDGQIFAEKARGRFGNQIEALLIGKARNDSDKRPGEIVRRQAE